MTVSNTTAKVTRDGDGSTTSFSFSPIVIYESSDLEVTKIESDGTETTLAEGVGSTTYSVTVVAYPGTGTITYPASGGTPLAADESIVIRRVMPLEQETRFNNQGGYLPENVEKQFDKLVMIDIQQQEELDRAVKFPVSESTGGELPTIEERKGRYLYFDETTGDPVAAALVETGVAISAFAETFLDDADAAAVRETLGLGEIDLDTFDGIFSVTDAENPWSGDDASDTSWMNGVWLTKGLYWDDTYKMLSRVEANKNDDLVGLCILPTFPGETFAGIATFRVQGTDSMIAAGNVHGVGLPDRLIWPSYGAVGGWEMGEVWTSEGQRAAGGSVQEMDGDGATAGYARRVFKMLLDDGTYQTWFYGNYVNAYADSTGLLGSSDSDVAAASNIRWGIIFTINKAAKTWSNIREVIDYGAPSAGAITWTRILDRKLGSGVAPLGGRVLHVRDEKAANTAGGTFTSGAWQTRTLNTGKVNEIDGASLATNQITLPAGTYEVEAWAIGNNCGSHKLRLYNTTDGADLVIGMSMAHGATTNNAALLKGRFTLTGTKVIELQHRCASTQATTGFGMASNLDSKVEVYADVFIKEVKGG